MKIFVTGGTGFVGSHLVEHLLDAGHDVVCLVRSPAKAEALFPERRPRLVQGTLFDVTALRQAADGADVIVHGAAVLTARSRAKFFEVNEGGTRQVLQAAPASLRRFVYVSSLAAAGPSRRGRQLQGGEREAPVTHYGASKLAGELVVRGGAVPWTIVRPPSVYGPRDVEFLRVFRMVRKGLMPMFGDGSQELSFVYVTDLARALLAVAGPRDTAGQVYYPCHPDVVRQRAFVQAVARAVRPDAPPPRLLPLPGALARAGLWVTGSAAWLMGRATMLSADKANEFLAEAWTCSPAALERDTGWTATNSLSVGLAKTVAWYRDQGWL